jgi:HD-GYP domain-containing protein (c-di-GMP phosphodiesterase class II)
MTSEAQIDAVCEALADFADIRSSRRWAHSTVVARYAGAIAESLGLTTADAQRARRAGLVHDLGTVAVPLWILNKTEPLSDGEREQLLLHPYYTERVLERVRPLQHLAFEASSHHESVNGQGYHRRLRGEQIPLLGRILAAADAYATQPSADPAGAIPALRQMVGTQLDATCYQALEAVMTGRRPNPTPEPRRVASQAALRLTDRENEVLQLLARGLSNPQISDKLVISKKTVEHHLEHIYDKLGVSTRTSAVAYAVQYLKFSIEVD